MALVPFIIVMAVSALVAAATNGLKPPLEGYTAVPMVLHGVNKTDAAKVTFSGTIQEIYKQLEGVEEDIELDLHPDPSTPLAADQAHALTAQTDNILCWIGGSGLAANQPLQDGIDYLRRVSSPCTAAPGPRVCTRISCSWGTAIWFCNDTPREKQRSCADLGGFAEDIRTECHVALKDGYYVRGQKFDIDNFNVIVGADDC